MGQEGWDDPLLLQGLLQTWKIWEVEPKISFPRPYVLQAVDQERVRREVYVFCLMLERKLTGLLPIFQLNHGLVHLSFVLARSRVAHKCVLSMPRLVLCTAVTGVQLVQLLQKVLTLQIDKAILWSDSTTVLTWLCSEPCHFKVFLSTRVVEI